MPKPPALARPCTQAQFAELVGIAQPTVSDLIASGVLERGGTARQWLQAYCTRLREQAAAREAEGSLAKERAGLARVRRIAQEAKNAEMAKGYAPVDLMAELLQGALGAAVECLDQLDGLQRECPDLPANARTVVHRAIADARHACGDSIGSGIERWLSRPGASSAEVSR